MSSIVRYFIMVEVFKKMRTAKIYTLDMKIFRTRSIEEVYSS